jgi:hypothetical protein
LIHEIAKFSQEREYPLHNGNVFQDVGVFADIINFGMNPELLCLPAMFYPFMVLFKLI